MTPRKEKKKMEQPDACILCGEEMIPDLEAKNVATEKWDGHTFKFNCKCKKEYEDLRVSIGWKNEKEKRSILVQDRWEIYLDDGVIYDTKEAKDIPQWIFDLRDFIVEFVKTEKEKCLCACHENKLNKPYEHDMKCCDEMNGVIKEQTEEWEEKLKEIMEMEEKKLTVDQVGTILRFILNEW